VVAAHGGTIAIASRPGEGTEVKVRLPRAGGEETRA
jgi:signal transduction histidine kinase